jgi:hypothetical protein
MSFMRFSWMSLAVWLAWLPALAWEPCLDDGDCGVAAYCARPPGLCDGPGVCASRPEQCIDLWAPVCGCDHATYANPCDAAAAGVSIGYPGECATGDRDGDGIPDGADSCPEVPNPDQEDRDGDGLGDLCDHDEDGDGYYCPKCVVPPCPALPCTDCDDQDPDVHPQAPEFCRDRVDNDCDGLVDCADGQDCGGQRACRGKGRQEDDLKRCGDGRDNDRDGLVDCADPGCRCICGCPEIYEPVCGADGRTYPNPCEATCAGVEIAYRGECVDFCGGIAGFPCPEGEVCNLVDPSCSVSDLAGTCVGEPEACPQIYEPVCGCDGITYPNDCERLRAGAILARDGHCCDDGGPVLCDMVPPTCPEGTVLAVQGGCYQCVDPETCKPPY